MPSILFVCFANQIRSPLAAAFMQIRLREAGLTAEWRVQSAGIWPGSDGFMPPEVLRELKRADFPGEERHPRPVTEELMKDQDLILVMEKGHKEALESEFPQVIGRVFLLSDVAEGVQYNIPDPGRSGYTLEETARDLRLLVDKGFEEICRRAASARGAD